MQKSLNDNIRELIVHFETGKYTNILKNHDNTCALITQLYKQVHDPIVYLTSVIRIRYRPTPLPPDFIVKYIFDFFVYLISVLTLTLFNKILLMILLRLYCRQDG